MPLVMMSKATFKWKDFSANITHRTLGIWSMKQTLVIVVTWIGLETSPTFKTQVLKLFPMK